MTQPTHLPNNHIAVPVPEDIQAHIIVYDTSGNPSLGYYAGKPLVENVKEIKLPPGTWQIICTTKDVTEEVAKGIVETIHIEHAPGPGNDFQGDWEFGYVDYKNRGEFAGWGGDAGYFRQSISSFHSLLRSLNLNGHYLILKKDIAYAI